MQLQLSLAVADRLHETMLVRGEPIDALEAVSLLTASSGCPPSLCREILSILVRQDRRFCWVESEQGPERTAMAGEMDATEPLDRLPLARPSVDVPRISLQHWEPYDPDWPRCPSWPSTSRPPAPGRAPAR